MVLLLLLEIMIAWDNAIIHIHGSIIGYWRNCVFIILHIPGGEKESATMKLPQTVELLLSTRLARCHFQEKSTFYGMLIVHPVTVAHCG